MSTSTTVIFGITLSSPYLIGGMLVWINVLGTSRTMIYNTSYAFIISFKETVSSDAVGLEVSSLDSHSLAGFPLNIVIPLSFVVVLLLLLYYYRIQRPYLLLWIQWFNKNRPKTFHIDFWSISFVRSSRLSHTNF